MESTWKSGISRDPLLYLRPNPFFLGIVRMLLEEQKVGLLLVRDYRFSFLLCAYHADAVRIDACVYKRAYAQLYRGRVLFAVTR